MQQRTARRIGLGRMISSLDAALSCGEESDLLDQLEEEYGPDAEKITRQIEAELRRLRRLLARLGGPIDAPELARMWREAHHVPG